MRRRLMDTEKLKKLVSEGLSDEDISIRMEFRKEVIGKWRKKLNLGFNSPKLITRRELKNSKSVGPVMMMNRRWFI